MDDVTRRAAEIHAEMVQSGDAYCDCYAPQDGVSEGHAPDCRWELSWKEAEETAEEAEMRDVGMSDYQERMHERRQMGLVNF